MAIIKKLKAIKTNNDHLLGIQDLSFSQVSEILKQAKKWNHKKLEKLKEKTIVFQEILKSNGHIHKIKKHIQIIAFLPL